MNHDEILQDWHRQTAKLSMPPCPYCGSNKYSLVGDHVVPRSKGGSNDSSNKEQICPPCNSAKGDMSKAEFIEYLDQLVTFRTKKRRNKRSYR